MVTIILKANFILGALTPGTMEKKEFEMLRDLMILLLIKSGVSYEAIASVTGTNVKTVQNRFPLKSITRKRENV
jgi:hypothetical protein